MEWDIDIRVLKANMEMVKDSNNVGFPPRGFEFDGGGKLVLWGVKSKGKVRVSSGGTSWSWFWLSIKGLS